MVVSSICSWWRRVKVSRINRTASTTFTMTSIRSNSTYRGQDREYHSATCLGRLIIISIWTSGRTNSVWTTTASTTWFSSVKRWHVLGWRSNLGTTRITRGIGVPTCFNTFNSELEIGNGSSKFIYILVSAYYLSIKLARKKTLESGSSSLPP